MTIITGKRMLAALAALAAALYGLNVATAPAAQATPAARPAALPTRGPGTGIDGLSIMAVGDAVAHGVGSLDHAGYRGELTDYYPNGLRWLGSQGAAPLWHEGHDGWTMLQLSAAARGWTSLWHPKVVFVTAGTADALQGATGAQMLGRATTLLDELRAGAGPKALLVLPKMTITWGAPAAVQQQEEAFNAGLDALIAGRADRTFVKTLDLSVNIELDYPTGIYPDRAGYYLMAYLLRGFIPAVSTG